MWMIFFSQRWVRTILNKSAHCSLCQGRQCAGHLSTHHPHFCKCCSRAACNWTCNLMLVSQKTFHFGCSFPSPRHAFSLLLKGEFNMSLSLRQKTQKPLVFVCEPRRQCSQHVIQELVNSSRKQHVLRVAAGGSGQHGAAPWLRLCPW